MAIKRVALMVGVDRYEDEAFRDLRYSVADAAALAAAFGRHGFEAHVATNPGNAELLKEVELRSAGLGEGDVFLFFFAGHGYTGPGGEHLLICSDDRLKFLRHNRAGVPVDLLEELTNGKGFHRAFLLDACRTDVFSGTGARGAESRDLGLVGLPDARKNPGTCCVVRSCDRFCPALEYDALGHGVFTRAILDLLAGPEGRALRMGEEFVGGLREKMSALLRDGNVQNPHFDSNGAAFSLFGDGDAGGGAAPAPAPVAPETGQCALCNRWRPLTEMFECRRCRKTMCIEHQDPETFLCVECAGGTPEPVRRKEPRRGEESGRWCQRREDAFFADKGDDFRKGARTVAANIEEIVQLFRSSLTESEIKIRLGMRFGLGGIPPASVFEMAAEGGNPWVQGALGWMFANGRGVPKNDAKAAEWCRKAAEQGDEDAQAHLGWFFENGCGVPRDFGEAKKWYRIAADRENPFAQNRIGEMHFAGRGAEQSDAKALEWYWKAANRGFAPAQCNLGRMFENGRGVARSDAEAAKWYRKAAEQGDAEAKKLLLELAKRGEL